MKHFMLLLFVCASCTQTPIKPTGTVPELVCTYVSSVPELDGIQSDPSWAKAKALTVCSIDVLNKHNGKPVYVELRAVRTDTHIYLLAVWEDATRNETAHKPWVWKEDLKKYVEGSEREDMFSVAFELRGEFTADMLSPVDGAWDIWHWKATRTNPQGYAMDRAHFYSKTKPEYKAKEFRAKDGSTLFIARPEDKGKTVEGKVPAPKELTEKQVSQYTNNIPDKSAADIRAKGKWENGKWTLEFARALNTGNDDDTQFDVTRSYLMAIGTHDNTGDMDRSSSVIKLTFVAR